MKDQTSEIYAQPRLSSGKMRLGLIRQLVAQT